MWQPHHQPQEEARQVPFPDYAALARPAETHRGTWFQAPAHIAQNLALFDFTLTDQDMAQIAPLDRGRPMFEHTEERLVKFEAFVPDVYGQK